MVEKDENNNVTLDMDSKFLRVLMIVIAVFLLFAGPTYVPYLLSNILKIGSFISVALGFILFIAGVFLMVFLVRKKIIS